MCMHHTQLRHEYVNSEPNPNYIYKFMTNNTTWSANIEWDYENVAAGLILHTFLWSYDREYEIIKISWVWSHDLITHVTRLQELF